MNVNIIRTEKELKKIVYMGGHIIEVTENEDELVSFSLFDFNTEDRSYREIAPHTIKHNIVPVYNCIYNPDSVYFARVEEGQPGVVSVCIYRYLLADSSTNEIYTFEQSRAIIGSSWKRVKVFVLSPHQFIIQTEQIKDWDSKNLMGNIEFALNYIDAETGDDIQVRDPNLVNNGINTIIPVTAMHIMLKTGYSRLEDSRFSKATEKEALIESVYYGTLSHFISSLPLENGSSGVELIETAYYSKYISRPQVEDDYIFFNVVGRDYNFSEGVFYNYRTGEKFICQNKEITAEDPGRVGVISNTPYVIRNAGNEVRFINLKTSEADCAFETSAFETVIGRLFVVNRKRLRSNRIQGFIHPGLELVLEEKGCYTTGCFCNDDYYLYLKV